MVKGASDEGTRFNKIEKKGRNRKERKGHLFLPSCLPLLLFLCHVVVVGFEIDIVVHSHIIFFLYLSNFYYY